MVHVTHLCGDAVVIGVRVPVYPIMTVLQRERGDKHLCPQKLGSLCYNPGDLLNLCQLYLKPLVHVITLQRQSPRVGSCFGLKMYTDRVCANKWILMEVVTN